MRLILLKISSKLLKDAVQIIGFQNHSSIGEIRKKRVFTIDNLVVVKQNVHN